MSDGVQIARWSGILICCISSAVWGSTMRSLIDLQYREFRKAWEADGRPAGGFLSSNAQPSFFTRSSAFVACSWSWMRRDPEWIRTTSRGLRLLYTARSWAGISLIGLVIWAGAVTYGLVTN
jgi:hypothetical protein